jgi:hypothetical protein
LTLSERKFMARSKLFLYWTLILIACLALSSFGSVILESSSLTFLVSKTGSPYHCKLL